MGRGRDSRNHLIEVSEFDSIFQSVDTNAQEKSVSLEQAVSRPFLAGEIEKGLIPNQERGPRRPWNPVRNQGS